MLFTYRFQNTAGLTLILHLSFLLTQESNFQYGTFRHIGTYYVN
jgi:hypothetical protein